MPAVIVQLYWRRPRRACTLQVGTRSKVGGRPDNGALMAKEGDDMEVSPRSGGNKCLRTSISHSEGSERNRGQWTWRGGARMGQNEFNSKISETGGRRGSKESDNGWLGILARSVTL